MNALWIVYLYDLAFTQTGYYLHIVCSLSFHVVIFLRPSPTSVPVDPLILFQECIVFYQIRQTSLIKSIPSDEHLCCFPFREVTSKHNEDLHIGMCPQDAFPAVKLLDVSMIWYEGETNSVLIHHQMMKTTSNILGYSCPLAAFKIFSNWYDFFFQSNSNFPKNNF